VSIRDVSVRLGADGQLWYRSTGDLTDRWMQTPNPIWERQRIYYGREISPEIIERAIVSADHGFLRELSDLIAEQTRVDPHWSMCDRKRLRAVNGAQIEVVPASGDGIDVDKATRYAGIVRKQVLGISNLKQALVQLNWAHKHGRGAQEKIWAELPAAPGSDSVKFRIDSLNWIHARRLAFGPERELRVRDDIWGGLGFEARGLDLRDYPFKFIPFLPQQFDDYPEREGYGVRGLFWSFFKRFANREQLVLLEQFGRPWRHLEEVDPGNKPVNSDSLKAGAEELDKAAANATGYAPPGTKIVTEQPQEGAGQVHKDVKEDSNDELSKLILGEVRTSDAKPTALGGAGDKVADEVQDEVKIEDAEDLSAILTDCLAKDIIVLNFDAGELDHAPRVKVFYESPPDRTVEIDRTTKAFSLGIPLKEDEVYARIGFTKPVEGDAVIKQAPQPAGPFGAPAQPGASESTTPGADQPGDGVEPAARALNSAAPMSFETLARAAHVLELTRYLGSGTQVVRSVVPPKPAGK
jgi:phage gp29-like protein